MGSISSLLKWKKPLSLKDQKGRAVKEVWLRVLDDTDLQAAYRDARLASAAKRAELRDTKSKAYKDDVLIIDEATREQCIELIRAARGNSFTSDAFSNVVRPDLPKLEDIAVDPDAASLEEQEKFDKAVFDTEKEYRKAIDDYVVQRLETLDAELAAMKDKDLREVAKDETSNVIALSFFLSRVLDEKCWRSVWEDEKFKIRGFDSYEDWDKTDAILKQQIREAYQQLEVDPDDLKN